MAKINIAPPAMAVFENSATFQHLAMASASSSI